MAEANAPIGYVVLSRRPAPLTVAGWDYEVVSDVYQDELDHDVADMAVGMLFPEHDDGTEYVIAALQLRAQKATTPLRDAVLCVRCGRPDCECKR